MVPLRADTEMQAMIEELADKCAEGRLTPKERGEYEGKRLTNPSIRRPPVP